MRSIYHCYEIDVQANTSNYDKSTYSKTKVQKIITEIGGELYTKKGLRD